MTDPEIKCAVCGWKQLRPYVFRTDDGVNFWCGFICRKALQEKQMLMVEAQPQ